MLIDLGMLVSKKRGLYGTYYKGIGKTGVKVLSIATDNKGNVVSGGVSSLAILFKSREWANAKAEVKLLERASALVQCVPKVYGVVAVRKSKLYFAAILMEHIEGKPLVEATLEDKAKAQEQLRLSLHEVGITHRDLHFGNIVTTQDKKRPLVALDFSPGFIDFAKKD